MTKFGIISGPRPQTFCSHARTRQNIVIMKKIVKHWWLLYTCATFRELRRTYPWDSRAILLFVKSNRPGHVLFPFVRYSTVGTRKRLCVFGGLCVAMWRLVHQWSFFCCLTVFDCFWRLVHYCYTVCTVLVDLWRLIHQWSFLLFWLSFHCFWYAVGTRLVQSW